MKNIMVLKLAQILLKFYGITFNRSDQKIDEMYYDTLVRTKIRKLRRLNAQITVEEFRDIGYKPTRRFHRQRHDAVLYNNDVNRYNVVRSKGNVSFEVEKSSHIEVSTAEKEVLGMGLNFALTPNAVDRYSVATQVKALSKSLFSGGNEQDIMKANLFGRRIFAEFITVSSARPVSNVKASMIKAIKTLGTRMGIVIRRAYKGLQPVLWCEGEYCREAELQLKTSVY
ncbi:hypothetical protein GJ496_001616 [Pomphorhynchus laevis]|nr:hypothetical protein GJ496_001616 [Pomphorhynchus laevis]